MGVRGDLRGDCARVLGAWEDLSPGGASANEGARDQSCEGTAAQSFRGRDIAQGNSISGFQGNMEASTALKQLCLADNRQRYWEIELNTRRHEAADYKPAGNLPQIHLYMSSRRACNLNSVCKSGTKV